jgi:uncharacterized protein (TIGR00369 family)
LHSAAELLIKRIMDMIFDAFRNLTGREYLEKLMEGPGASPMGQTLDMRLIAVGEGTATFEGRTNERHLNPQGAVHGGWFATILDSAMGCAVQSRLGKGVNFGTVEMKVNFIRPMSMSTGRVLCHGRVIHGGRRTSVVEARLEDEQGRLLAISSGTFMVYEE